MLVSHIPNNKQDPKEGEKRGKWKRLFAWWSENPSVHGCNLKAVSEYTFPHLHARPSWDLCSAVGWIDLKLFPLNVSPSVELVWNAAHFFMSPISNKADAHLGMMSGYFSISVKGLAMGDTDLMHLNIVADITSPGSAHTRLVLLVQFLFVFAILSYIFSLSLSLHRSLHVFSGNYSWVFLPLPLLYKRVHHPSQTQKHKTQRFMLFLHLCPFEIHVRSCVRSTHEAGRTSDQRI